MIGIKEAAALLTAKGRKEQNKFLAEGQKLIDEAIRSGYRQCAVWKVEEVGGKAFSRLCDTKTPQGIVAAFEIPESKEKFFYKDKCYVLLENLQNPGNAGSIIRTAEAMGAKGVIFCGEAVDIYSQKMLRGSMGSALRVPTFTFDTPALAKESISKAGLELWGSALTGKVSKLGTEKFSSGVIAVGNEGAGLSGELLNLCDKVVTIPMKGGTESLSAPAAAAILMWELFGK